MYSDKSCLLSAYSLLFLCSWSALLYRNSTGIVRELYGNSTGRSAVGLHGIAAGIRVCYGHERAFILGGSKIK